MKNFIIIILSIFVLSSFTENPSSVKVSLINLIATPERFDNKSIIVKGYYSHRFESTRLYLDETSAKNNIYENSVTIFLDSSMTDKMMNAKDKSYIQIEGYFKMAPANNKNTYDNYIYKACVVDSF